MEWFEYLSFGDSGWGDELASGLGITLSLALVSLPIGLALGFAVAAASVSERPVPRIIAFFFTTTIRGLPELLTLFIIYHGVGLLISKTLKWFNPEAGFFELSPFVAGAVALGLVFGGYSGEVLRGAWQALDKGQQEAAQAIGMNRLQIFRLIEFPQMLRLALPGLGNLWINLLKDTALVSVIALSDLMRIASVAVGATKKPFLFFLTVCLIYWVICIFFEWCIAKMEKRANRGIRAS
ncbi:ABC transporter permease [Amphritea balenae]|uniref:ABC transporter permease subunit n=1 Tax=Amphritea balenae TaxID=452629 RepID=A0A3P1SYE0_9GAMM|nr:ABC transporter permease subunit [Amphritea balenae]RRD01566.1 ABC transporter permease subunit [Amphritea balenae]GGK55851.1 ABC transporter permease [Amphritea balenae]